MAVVAADMDFFLSGGSGNSDPAASLGGQISSTQVIFSPILNNLFDDVDAAQALAGSVEYRCIYISNTNGTDDIDDVVIWISSNTPSGSTIIAIGLDPAGIGDGSSTGVAVTPSPLEEDTTPPGVDFAVSPLPTSQATGLAIGTLLSGECQAIWVRRTVSPGAAPAANDPFTLNIGGAPA